MLTRPRGGAEPGVVGDIDDPGRTGVAAGRGEARIEALVADQRLDLRRIDQADRRGFCAGAEVGGHVHQAAHADLAHQPPHGQVFAEGHQTVLVVDGADAHPRRALVVQGEQAVVIAGAALGGRIGLAAAQAHQQGLTGLQGAGNRLGVGRVEDVVGGGGQGPLGPDHHVGNHRPLLGGQGDIAVDDGLIGLRRPLGFLRNVGLDQTHQGRAIDPLGRRQARGAEAEQARQNGDAQAGGDQTRPPRSVPDQQAERRDPRQGNEAQAIDPADRGELRHGRTRRPGRAGRVPRKAGQDMAAQPFQQGEQGGEQQDAARARWRETAIKGRGRAEEEPQPHGQQAGGEGRHPGLILVDQKGLGHPPAADEEVGKARQPADPEAALNVTRPLGQQHQQGIAQQARQDPERRMGQGRPGARQQGQGDAAPAVRQHAPPKGRQAVDHAVVSRSA
ncbi:hypothetical protein D3C80_956240 [compost metagenome]